MLGAHWLRGGISVARMMAVNSLHARGPLAPTAWVFDAHTPARRNVLELARRVAPSACAVLILGPTGVGKEVLANDLHRNSPRASCPFVAVNCAAFAPALFESTLFGHARGAFTGATSERKGLVELADGGTLFLDEIGELHPDVQPKLLRFLAQGTFWPVGSNVERRVDVRIIAATHRNIEEFADGSFREDLFYRLSAFVLRIPPLEPSDVRVIAQSMALEAVARHGVHASLEEIETVADQCAMRPWRGGARELRNMIDRTFVLRNPTRTMAEHCAEILGLSQEETGASSGVRALGLGADLMRDLDNLIFLGMAAESRDVRALAERTNRTVQAVYARLKKLGLGPNDLGRTPAVLAAAQMTRERLAAQIPWLKSLLAL